MNENLKQTTSELIEEYIDIIEEIGDPHEIYKYDAVNTFQENWDLETDDFYQMLKASLKKVTNLLYQNPRGFIEKSAEHFPEEVREMFRNLYDESIDLSKRIQTFQSESEKLLPKLKLALNRTNVNAQQDERTISLYLAFRYPEKYILYKNDYYKEFCNQLNVKPKKSGNRFLHFQDLADKIIQEDVLKNEKFIHIYRKYHPEQNWDDKYFMIQNVLFDVFTHNKDSDLTSMLKYFSRDDLKKYYEFLDKIIETFDLRPNDKRLVFNLRNRKHLVLIIGQRYVWLVSNPKSSELTFCSISSEGITEKHSSFIGNPAAYWNATNNFSEIRENETKIFDAIKHELNRTEVSGFSKHNKKN